jgi:hypothetical protein
MSLKLAKVQVTSGLSDWWESDLLDIFADPDRVRIISAIEYNGGLYLIYEYESIEDDDLVIP